MFEFDFPWAFALLPAALLVWLLLPAYRERRESVRVPFFEKLAAATGTRPARGPEAVTRGRILVQQAPLNLDRAIVDRRIDPRGTM